MGDDGYTRNVTGDRENLGYLEDLIRLVLAWEATIADWPIREEIKNDLYIGQSTTGEERERRWSFRGGIRTLITFIRNSMISSRSKSLGRQDDMVS